MATATAIDQDNLFAVLRPPRRRAIITFLRVNESAPVKEIAVGAGIGSKSKISQELGVLLLAGLVEKGWDGQRRRYRLTVLGHMVGGFLGALESL